MGPGPKTATVCPGLMPDISIPFNVTANGSVIEAISSDIFSGMDRISAPPFSKKYSAKTPL